MTRSRRILRAAALASAAAMTLTALPAIAHAEPSGVITSTEVTTQMSDITVHSAAMGRDIPLTVLKPKDTSKPAPVLYLLNGAGGGEDSATWQLNTDIVKFFANKHVYVVIPMQGAFSYYTDWIKADEKLGVNKWGTFLADELPPAIDGSYKTTGKNAIAGISSSATSVLNLAIANKGLYRAVGSYSGCASTSSEHGTLFMRIVVETRGGGDVRNMWGELRGPLWKKNDPIRHAEGLRGLSLYLSAATGLPGEHDNLREVPEVGTLADRLVVGGAIETATRVCTEQLASRLQQLHIPATVDRPVGGTHSWPYWQDQLHKSWPQLGRAIGA
ncbi:esterase family protein [Gordonia sp. PDNC005]|uniref:alpha/beta hydrolase n=1 Tax=unclassified Gordonia (in: high G+C Gram-positive bacteria) TaxID=2657482 RepID=UPI0019622FAE|nr:alpha/beta hydrolase family protein [Gordonia sp. PDNC005]QRY61881.1 esterase family protein [Gordonia sp. PDNC005]